MPIEIRNSDGSYQTPDATDVDDALDAVSLMEMLGALAVFLRIGKPLERPPEACYTIRDLMLAGF